jgi:hypothetical protein
MLAVYEPALVVALLSVIITLSLCRLASEENNSLKLEGDGPEIDRCATMSPVASWPALESVSEKLIEEPTVIELEDAEKLLIATVAFGVRTLKFAIVFEV